MSRTEKILVRGVNWLGDAVMTTPALQRLREAQPHAHITLLTHEKLTELWSGHPSIDATLSFAGDESVFRVARKLRRERFDIAAVFPNSPRSALEVFLARIPQRIGYARNFRRLLLTDTLPPRVGEIQMHKRSCAEIRQRIASDVGREIFPVAAHHVHDYLHIVSALGANPSPLPPLLHVGNEEVAAVRSRFHWSSGQPLFALNPGAEYGPAKRWPAERFADAAIQLHERLRCHWVILGGSADATLASGMATRITARIGSNNITNVAGKTSLRELCAILKACALVVTNDTGPMHVAAAVGTPVVVPVGSTSPELTGPLSAVDLPHQILLGDVPCAPCFLRECPIDFRCMKSISAEQVVEAGLRAALVKSGH